MRKPQETTMYTSILIAADGSDLAAKAVQDGIALANRIGAKVTVLTVLPFRRRADAGRR